MPVVEAVRRSTDLPLDVHLMISEPARYLRPFREAGADLLTIHVEAVADPAAAAAGNSVVGGGGRHLAESAHAGRGARRLPRSLRPGAGDERHAGLRRPGVRAGGAGEAPPAARSVGGRTCCFRSTAASTLDTVGPCAEAGADVFVTGSALFSQDDYGRFIERDGPAGTVGTGARRKWKCMAFQL